jgi:hypothetical protein
VTRDAGRGRGRPHRIALTGIVLLVCSLAVGVGASGGQVSDQLSVAGTGTVTFSAVVRPNGRATTAYFEFGLAPRYREPRPSRVVYDESTQTVQFAADHQAHGVSGRVSGLVPNAVYHLRLVAKSSAGTVYSGDASFRTARDPAPPTPQLGVSANVRPVSGLVLIQPPRATSDRAPRLVEGAGFVPLTEPLGLPIGAKIDARAGAVRISAAGSGHRRTQRAVLAGGVISLSQTRARKGRVTINLLEGAFPGAPAYSRCGAHRPAAGAALQTLRVRAQRGRLRVLSRYSTGSTRIAGTAWDTVDRCDGTLTIVRHGKVFVTDAGRGTTVAVHAGQRFLARPAPVGGARAIRRPERPA